MKTITVLVDNKVVAFVNINTKDKIDDNALMALRVAFAVMVNTHHSNIVFEI
jgi:hypothetical protein